jgi:ribosomal protein L37AE/L43A
MPDPCAICQHAMRQMRCPACGRGDLARGTQNFWCRCCGFFPIAYRDDEPSVRLLDTVQVEVKQLMHAAHVSLGKSASCLHA